MRVEYYNCINAIEFQQLGGTLRWLGVQANELSHLSRSLGDLWLLRRSPTCFLLT